jgi:hypothetical protein
VRHKLSDLSKTWFIDFDGTLVLQKSHLSEQDRILPRTLEFFKNHIKENDYVVITTARNGNEHKDRISRFMMAYGLKCDLIICDLPTGPRIVVNDTKPDGMVTAYSVKLTRDSGIEEEDLQRAFN